MSNYNLIRLLQELENNHLFYKWKKSSYQLYMKNIITSIDKNGPDYVFNRFNKLKLPFVIFRTDDTFYYIDKTSNNIIINKYNDKLVVQDNFDLGNRNGLKYFLRYILQKV